MENNQDFNNQNSAPEQGQQNFQQNNQQNFQQNNQQNFQQNNQQFYQQPANQYPADKDTTPLTMGNYLVMFILQAIPIVNLIMPFVWAFGDRNVNKNNFGKAMLIMMAVVIVLYIILIAAGIGMMASFSNIY